MNPGSLGTSFPDRPNRERESQQLLTAHSCLPALVSTGRLDGIDPRFRSTGRKGARSTEDVRRGGQGVHEEVRRVVRDSCQDR